MGTFSIWHWLVVLLIVVLVFGTKKLKNIGSDLGGAVKGFKDGMKDGTSGDASAPATPPAGQVTGSTATDKTSGWNPSRASMHGSTRILVCLSSVGSEPKCLFGEERNSSTTRLGSSA